MTLYAGLDVSDKTTGSGFGDTSVNPQIDYGGGQRRAVGCHRAYYGDALLITVTLYYYYGDALLNP